MGSSFRSRRGANDASAPPSDVGADVAWNLVITLAVVASMGAVLVLAIGGDADATVEVIVSVVAVVAVAVALARVWWLADSVRVLTHRRERDRLAAMVEHSHDVVLLVDRAGSITYASPGLDSTLGRAPSDWIGRPLIDLADPRSREAFGAEVARVAAAGPDVTAEFEPDVLHQDGRPRRVEVAIVNLLGDDAVDGMVVTLRDVTEQREHERRLRHRAHHDELTGLANRALFLDRVDEALRAQRPHDAPVVLLFVDLDDFKAVNDALGHAVGDGLLAAISAQIIDVSSEGDTPARLGGDEFAVLLGDVGGVERAVELGEELLRRLAEPQCVAGYELTVQASVGVAVAAPGMTTSALLRDADTAMYEAKRAGKGQLKLFDPAMQLRSTGRLASRSDLAAAFDDGQLRLVYQPFVSLETGRVLGAQAIVRWRHPERGDVPSDEFIPIAETTGLVGPIGRWILREAIAEGARWQRAADLRLGIKVPRGLLRAPGFVEEVENALDGNHLPPDRLGLAIPGDTVVDALDGAQGMLHRLRSLGIKISVADFGAGDLALVDLRRASVDLMQIDRRFVEELTEGIGLARVLLETCATLGIASAANGIARAGELEMLRQLGCTYGRGPLISPPLEVEEIRRRFGVAPAEPPYASVDG